MLFRELNQAEAVEFIDWANDNYTAGDDIDREWWHPAIVQQCDRINQLADHAARLAHYAETPQQLADQHLNNMLALTSAQRRELVITGAGR